MTILGRGDLSPRRHHRRFGRDLLVVLVVIVLAAAGYFLYRHFSGGSSSPRASTPPVCKDQHVTGPASPSTVHVKVLNGTLTSGLAAQVATQLRHRGFHVNSVGNTQKLVKTGTAVVSYGPGRELAAQAVAVQFPGAQVVKGTAAGVQVAIGGDFNTLSTKAEASRARQQFVTEDASTAPSPSPSPSPTCRAQIGSTP